MKFIINSLGVWVSLSLAQSVAMIQAWHSFLEQSLCSILSGCILLAETSWWNYMDVAKMSHRIMLQLVYWLVFLQRELTKEAAV